MQFGSVVKIQRHQSQSENTTLPREAVIRGNNCCRLPHQSFLSVQILKDVLMIPNSKSKWCSAED